MLTTQINGTNFGGLGALVSSAATAELQRYLASIGKLSQSNVTGVMNDATMAVIFNLLVSSAATVAKIPLLPQDIRNGISTVTGALQSADNKIKSVTFGMASLSSVLGNWATINAAVRAVSSSAADAMAAAREAVYNTVASASSTILAAVKVFFPPTTTSGATQPSSALISQLISPIKLTMATGVVATATPAGQQSFPAGTIYAFSKKIGKYRIAIPKGMGGGLGIEQSGVFGDCVFGDCGLGAAATMTEVAPSSTPPPNGVPTTETELEKRTGTLPFYKNWMFWAAVGGGVAVVGTGTALLLHRRKKVA